jgi:hypothetical protein
MMVMGRSTYASCHQDRTFSEVPVLRIGHKKSFVPCRIVTYRLPQSIVCSGNIPSRH